MIVCSHEVKVVSALHTLWRITLSGNLNLFKKNCGLRFRVFPVSTTILRGRVGRALSRFQEFLAILSKRFTGAIMQHKHFFVCHKNSFLSSDHEASKEMNAGASSKWNSLHRKDGEWESKLMDCGGSQYTSLC